MSEKKGGGVGFLIRDSIQSCVVATQPTQSFEHIVVSARFHNCSLNFVSIYRPPGSGISVFIDEFMSFYGNISTLSPTAIIAGDFNIHLDKNDATTSNFKALLSSCNLTQHINFPTHVHGHTLDALIVPSDFLGIGSIRNIGCISDHFCITCELDMHTPKQHSNKHITFRQYRKIDLCQMKADLLQTDFVRQPANNATQLYDQYVSNMSILLDKHAPSKTKCLGRPSPEWITQEYRDAKRLRRQYERAWRKNPTVLNRSRLRRQTARCNSIINKEKFEFYSRLVNNHQQIHENYGKN